MIKVIFILSASAVAMNGQEAESRVRASIGSSGEIWEGQEVPLVVELLAPGYFAGASVFDLPSVPGVLLIPPIGSPVVSKETIDGIDYVVQHHEVRLLPHRDGKLGIPPFEIRFSIKRNALDKEVTPQTVKTPKVAFAAKAPPGLKPGESILTSRKITANESWKPEPGEKAKAGDAFVRTIVFSAPDLPAMAFSPPDSRPLGGLGIYLGEPSLEESGGRGDSSRGQRTDTITYVCKHGGHAEIPGLSFRWWDPVRREMREIDFPARSFEIIGPPSVRAERSGWLVLHGRALAWSLASIAGITCGLWLTRRHWSVLLGMFRPRRLAPLNPATPVIS